MKLALVGPVDGNLKLLDNSLPKEIDWCLATGSMGIWPYQKFMDKPSKQYCGADFYTMYPKFEGFKHRILFVRGPHEDHFWIRKQLKNQTPEFLPNLIWLADGYKTELNEGVTVLGLGGTYSEKYFNNTYRKKIKLKTYRRQHVEKACSAGKVDILLLHIDPREGEHIAEIVKTACPRLIIHTSMYDKFEEYEFMGVYTIGTGSLIKNNGFYLCDFTKEIFCLDKFKTL